MLGLGVARRLAEAGQKVRVYEAQTAIGGLASSWQIGDVVWDKHYHVTLLSDSHTRELLRWLDLEAQLAWETTKTGCYGNGKLYSISNALEYLRFPLLNMFEKFRLAITILRGATTQNWRELETVTVQHWLTRWSGKGAFEKFWQPLLRSKLGESYKQTSAAFIWATIARLYAARKAGLAEERFGYVRGGYHVVLDAYSRKLEQLGVEICAGTRIESIESHTDGITIASENESETFDQTVLTLASPQLLNLTDLFSSAEKRNLAAHDYLGVVCASLVIPYSLSEYYVTNLIDSGFPFTGVIEMTALVDPKELSGNHLIYLPRYAGAQDSYWSKTTDEIRQSFLPALRSIHPGFREEDVLAFEVSKQKLVMPIPKLYASKNTMPIRCEQPGLFVANSAQIQNGTLNVNETLKLADIAAAEVLND